jgi:hypothetical protein
MVLTLKVISASMSYQDGLIKNEEDLRVSQRKNRLKELPSFVQYIGYCLNCGTHLAGHVYEIRDYIDWTEDKGVQNYIPHPSALKTFYYYLNFERSHICLTALVLMNGL